MASETIKPKTAAERVKRFGTQIVLFVKENPSEHLSGEEWCFVLHDEEFAERTKVQLIAALESMRVDTVEACCAEVAVEPEFPGTMSREQRLQAAEDPEVFLRAAVVLTKKNIEARLRAKLGAIEPSNEKEKETETD